jgi:hypothetical protein
LLAVLLWCKEDAKAGLAALSDSCVGIPEDWLSKLDGHKTAFNLLGDDARFYQDASLKDKKARAIADLLVEFPGADSVNHMRHVVHDGSYGFCPACCALGILRLSVWAPANRFYPASVNPGSAAYAILQEKNLLLTLVAYLPDAPAQVGQAPWLSDVRPVSPDTVANLAWRPRKLWLNVASEPGSCANCGSSGVLVANLCNEGGWQTPKTAGQTKKFWDADPHLLKDGAPISLPGLGTNAGAHCSRLWRDALRLRKKPATVVATGPVVNKFTFHDAISVNVPDASAQSRAKLSTDCSEKLRALLKRVTPNPDRQHPEINAAIVLLTPDIEARIRATLNDPRATADDRKFLHEIYEPLVEQVVASTARGSPLQRRAAWNHAQALLSKMIKQLVDKAYQPPGAADGAVSAKPKRSRKKKGGGA